nr:MAG TPA: hypothetical protein [Caudoviricetes sp.]
MNTVAKIYVINKVVEFAKKGIYRSEIINVGKAGIEKFNTVVDNFWDRVEEYIVKEKSIDRKWIPDTIENIGEEAIHEVVKTLRAELDPRKLVQEIFDLEKAATPEIF